MPYKVIWEWDGCPMEDASSSLATMEQAKTIVRNLQRKHHPDLAKWPKLDLGIIDLETERHISFVL